MEIRPLRILIQTTIPTTEDDWSIARFSKLGALLRAQRDDEGRSLYDVTMRDRGPVGAPDPVLSNIDVSDFNELWLLAVDTGDGLTPEDCAAITRFRAGGRGLLVTRDHMDLGCSVCTLGGLGRAHHFHSANPDPDPAKRRIDDPFTTYIAWPNFHSGASGDFQEIEVVGTPHPLLASEDSPTGSIRYLPAHPHEGGVGAPEGESARVIARGRSRVTGSSFNIAVAFEPGERGGAGLAQSAFHHFADYNWDTSAGSPRFVDEPPGDAIQRVPAALADTHRYVVNIAAWLARPALRLSMTSDWLKALTDGVVAVIITIMVLEMKPPAGDTPQALAALLQVFLSYGLSFVYVAIYWNNHHHFFLLTPKVNAAVLWANLNLLFWLSLIPFTTGWMGERELRPWPTAIYGLTRLACAIAWRVMQSAIIRSQGSQSELRRAVGGDWKGKASAAGYLFGVSASFLQAVVAALIYAAVASVWLLPDRRVHRVVRAPETSW